jgi:hypothetical protein
VRAVVAAAVVALAAACTDTDFTPRWRVERLRVVAVVADPPDAQPGEAVTLTAVTATRAGATGEPRVVWASCPRMGIDNATGARRCEGPPTAVDGRVARVTLGEAPADGAPWAFFGIACLGGAIGLDPATMLPRCAGGEGEVFLRTVRARRGAANHNPRIARVLLGGLVLPPDEPMVFRGPGQVRGAVRVEFAEGAREAYDEAQPDGSARPVRESLVTQFLTDGGELGGSFRADGEGADAPHEVSYLAPSGRDARLWVVVSDGRGGFDVAARALDLAP